MSDDENAGAPSGAVPIWPMRRPPAWRLASLALAIFAGASIGLLLNQDAGHVSSLWPANGIAVAVLLLSAPRDWLALLAAAWCGNALADAAFGNPIGLAAAAAALNALEIMGVAYVMRWRLGEHAGDLTRASSLLWFGVAGGVVVSGSLSLAAAALVHAMLGRPFWDVAAVWYPSHVLGLGVIVPMMLTLRWRERPKLVFNTETATTTLIVGLFVVATLGTFCQSSLPLLFLPLLPLIWVVARLGAPGASASLAFLATVSLIATIHGMGPLSLMTTATLRGKILFWQFYLLIGTGEALGVASVTAERARLSRSVKRSGHTFRLIADHASDIISRVARDGSRLYVSPAANRLLGLSPQARGGPDIFEHIHPDDRASALALQASLLQGQQNDAPMAFRAFHANGRLIWLESTARLLHDPATGRPDGYVTVTRDVTEREERAAEQAQRQQELEAANAQLDRLARHLARARDQADQANMAKSSFVAGMSHELRTPLNGILGYAQLLRLEGGLNPTQSLRVDAMLRAGRHLLELVNNVLDVSQIEAGRVDVMIGEVDAVEICQTCIELVRPAAIEKDLLLRVVADPGLPHILADRGRLRQVMVNLLGNALKFTLSGSVTLRLSLVPDLADPPMLRLAVGDTGPGVPADKRDKLFQQFQRLDASAGPAEGAGLGLAISRHLIELMQGQIGFEDNVPTGSVFWLELPAVAAAASAGPATPATHEAGGAKARLHILVVDDVSMNRDVARAFLRAGGHHAVCVDSGEDAVAQAAAREFDVILMDVRMPGMDGLEATRRIRALPGARGRVPIVALTANAFLDQVKECHEAGMDAHVVKPFDHSTLLETVGRVAAGERGDADAAAPRPPTSAVDIPAPRLPALGLMVARPSPEPGDRQTADRIPVLDVATFERTAALLEPSEILACLRTLQGRGTAIQNVVNSPDATRDEAWLGDAAHTIAGSAGMFGFLEVVMTGRALERALAAADPGRDAAAHALQHAIAAMQTEIDRHMEELELSTTGAPP